MPSYLVQKAVLTSTQSLLLGIYLGAVAFQIFVALFFVLYRKRLPLRFQIFGHLINLFRFIGLLISILFLVYISSECDLSRQVTYTFLYLSFLVYDYYQLLTIDERLKKRHYVLYGLFLLRVASLVLGVVDIHGAIVSPLASGPYTGFGACTTKVDSWVVYQEHVVVWLYEMTVVYHIFRHAYTFTSEHLRFWDIITTVLDFEALSFIVFMLCEVAYLLLFTLLPSNLVSYLNTGYAMLPVAFFFATSIYLVLDKKAQKMSQLAQIQHSRRTFSEKSASVNIDAKSQGSGNVNHL